jgi:hypothetical protein
VFKCPGQLPGKERRYSEAGQEENFINQLKKCVVIQENTLCTKEQGKALSR